MALQIDMTVDFPVQVSANGKISRTSLKKMAKVLWTEHKKNHKMEFEAFVTDSLGIEHMWTFDRHKSSSVFAYRDITVSCEIVEDEVISKVRDEETVCNADAYNAILFDMNPRHTDIILKDTETQEGPDFEFELYK